MLKQVGVLLVGLLLISPALADDEATKDPWRQAGELEYAKGAPDQALALYEAILKAPATPPAGRARALQRIAACQLALGREKEAVATLQRLLKDYGDQAAEVLEALRCLENARRVLWLRAPGADPRLLPTTGPKPENDAIARLRQRLKSTVIDKIRFEDAPVSKVFAFLTEKTRAQDPKLGGVNFAVFLCPPAAPKPDGAKAKDDGGADADDKDKGAAGAAAAGAGGQEDPEFTITMDFDNIPLADVVRYVCEGAGLRYELDEHAVVVLGPEMARGPLILRFYPVDPRLLGGDRTDGEEAVAYRRYFEDKGLTFPVTTAGEHAAIWYDRGTSQLIMRNTPENLALFERIQTAINIQIPMVKMSAELLEVSLPEAWAGDRQAPTRDLLMALPKGRRRTVAALELVAESGQEGKAQSMERIRLPGAPGQPDTVADHELMAMPRVGNDGKTIALGIAWSFQARPAAAAPAPKADEGAVAAKELPDLSRSITTELSLWDQCSHVMQVAAADPARGRGAVFVVFTASIMGPQGVPRRETDALRRQQEALRLLLGDERWEWWSAEPSALPDEPGYRFASPFP